MKISPVTPSTHAVMVFLYVAFLNLLMVLTLDVSNISLWLALITQIAGGVLAKEVFNMVKLRQQPTEPCQVINDSQVDLVTDLQGIIEDDLQVDVIPT